ADLQRGLDELHRRAGAHRQVVRRRTEAETLLGLPELPSPLFASTLADCRAKLTEVDRERRDGAQRLADASAHQNEHSEASSALRVLAGADVALDAAYSVALGQLRRLREARSLADGAPALARELDLARKLATRQSAARERSHKLGVVPDDGLAAESIRRALDETESDRARVEDAERAARAAHADIERLLKEMSLRRRELTDREPEWRELASRADHLADATGLTLVDRESLDRARALVHERLDAAREREAEDARVLERLHAEARELLAAGGPFDPELLRLRDQLGAELVASRFEDAGLDEAGLLEARLGPLAQALVVDDPRAAARAIATRASSLESVWLMAREQDGTPLADLDANPRPGVPDVLVDEGAVLRVSRIPERPRLGRMARERRAAELREEAALHERDLEEARAGRRALERLAEDGEALLAGHFVWLAGDPAPELAELRRRVAESEAQADLQRNATARHADASRALRPRIDGLRELLTDAHLIDPPDQTERAAALADQLQSALAAQAELARCSAAARVVEDRLEALRRPPLSEAEVAVLRKRVDELRRERDRLEGAIDAIDYVGQNIEALEWSDAPTKLQQNEALVPALEDQLRRAESARDHSEVAARLADAAHEQSTANWQTADGRRRAAFEQLTASEARFAETGIVEPTAEAVRVARAEVAQLEEALRAFSQRLSELATECGRRETECKQAAEKLRESDDKVTSERRDAEPAIERWERLRGLADQHNLLASTLSPEKSVMSAIRGHVNLVQEALKQKATLVERLRMAQGTRELLAEVEKGSDGSELAFGETHLELWLAVRDWLRRRLPAQVAEVDDPREALLRLRDQLASLDERLTRQENDLRGASEDVARGIDVQIRKARGQVNRLNKNLDGVRFGSIQGIRVRLQPVDRMEQVLRALREGAAQGLLFQENLPIEEALDEIFRRYGGGRAGSQRLLDYREYVHLQVEIRRSAGTDWEIANPTRLSTGEAIGVGAALMMVVLTEWEHDANLLRPKKSSGSLRFLFLDEANRLSHDNLGVLFDLCQTLDLQLLIAAPEVARAEGNTTYRLVRRTTGDGREEVLVSGRRTRADA
ncbi:chromosome partition protein MukB, partial [Myxococcota bacterium]|nr:chromosome partition protein MukB [Myxococcota bacterium]